MTSSKTITKKNTNQARGFLKYLPTIAVSVVTLTAVLWPGSKLPDPGIPALDKVVHFLLFSGWTIAIINDFDLKKWFVALVAGLAFALLTELIQLPVEGRSFDLNDLLADGAGVVFGLANAQFVIRIARKLLKR